MALLPPPTHAISASGSLPSFASSSFLPLFQSHSGNPAQSWKRMRSHHRSQHVMRIADARGPFPQRLVNSVLQRPPSRWLRMYFRAQKLHTVNVQRLPLHIFLSHEDLAFHAHQRGGRGRRHAVLARARLRNHARFTHFFAKSTCPSTLLILCDPVWLRSSRFR